MIIEAIQAAIAAVVGYFGKKAVVDVAEVAVADIPAEIAAKNASPK